jgi:hypothetical protein
MSRLLLSALLGSVCLVNAQLRTVFQVPVASPVAEITITLKPIAAPHRIELRNFSAAAMPIVHLLERGSHQIASASAKGTELSLSVDGKTAGDLTVVVRSGSANSASITTADLWVDGQLHRAKVPFSSGTVFSMPSITVLKTNNLM